MFKIFYHKFVAHDDIPRISKTWRDKIRLAIEQKLMTRPDIYGKPLRRSLKGYRKLRVGSYRIIFRIDSVTIKIIAIQNRSVIYSTVEKRIVNNH